MARWLVALALALAGVATDVGAARLASRLRELRGLRHALMISPSALQRSWCSEPRGGPEPVTVGLTCRTRVRWRPVAGAARSPCDVVPDPAGVEPARRYEVELACVVMAPGRAFRLPTVTSRLVR